MNSGLLLLAAAGLIIPAVFQHSSAEVSHGISVQIAVVLFAVYLGSLLYTLMTSRPAMGKEKVKAEVPGAVRTRGDGSQVGEEPGARRFSPSVTVALAFMSEILTDAIEPASTEPGVDPELRRRFLAGPRR